MITAIANGTSIIRVNSNDNEVESFLYEIGGSTFAIDDTVQAEATPGVPMEGKLVQVNPEADIDGNYDCYVRLESGTIWRCDALTLEHV